MAIARVADERDGVAFLVAAGIVYEIVAAACSSPQTTEINASTRASTLMKWVHLGLGQAALFVGAAAYLDRRRAPSYLMGGISAGVIMYVCYIHAKSAGLKSSLPGTETTYGSATGSRGLRWA